MIRPVPSAQPDVITSCRPTELSLTHNDRVDENLVVNSHLGAKVQKLAGIFRRLKVMGVCVFL